jgi:hypothetical protein
MAFCSGLSVGMVVDVPPPLLLLIELFLMWAPQVPWYLLQLDLPQRHHMFQKHNLLADLPEYNNWLVC